MKNEFPAVVQMLVSFNYGNRDWANAMVNEMASSDEGHARLVAAEKAVQAVTAYDLVSWMQLPKGEGLPGMAREHDWALHEFFSFFADLC